MDVKALIILSFQGLTDYGIVIIVTIIIFIARSSQGSGL